MYSNSPGSEDQRVQPATVRYIKLGPGGAWESASLDGGRIDWGEAVDLHELALTQDWDGARRHYLAAGIMPSTATGYVRELKDFYTLGSDCLWITFARGHLWWCFAEPEVAFIGGSGERKGSRYRRTIAGWRNTDIAGRSLTMDSLSTRLTQLAAYRRTICNVAEAKYLLRRINAEEEPAVVAARLAREGLITATAELIAQLHWADFELLVDLLFARSGWRRVSALGGTMKDIDLLLEEPVTGERASVQVKSAADQRVLDNCVAAFEASGQASRFFFVCHSPRGSLSLAPGEARPVHLWTSDTLAGAAVDQGLTTWLMERVG